MNEARSTSALMTRPRVRRDWLILPACQAVACTTPPTFEFGPARTVTPTLSRTCTAPLLPMHSEPATAKSVQKGAGRGPRAGGDGKKNEMQNAMQRCCNSIRYEGELSAMGEKDG